MGAHQIIERLLPLHPDALPLASGRGGIVVRFLNESKRLLCSGDWMTWLPLPKGEGRGEGEERDPSRASRQRFAAREESAFNVQKVRCAADGVNTPYRHDCVVAYS